MLNTSSCTRHLTLPFPTVNSSSATEQDYDNFSNLYGNLCSGDNCSAGEEMLDDFFPQEFYNNSQLSFVAEGCLRSKTDLVDNFDAPRAVSMATSPESLPRIKEKNDEEVPTTGDYDIGVCNSSSDGGCEPFTNSAINSNNVADMRRSPGTCKQSAEELMLSVGSQGSSDTDKRKAMSGGAIVASSRGKGRPVKSAQNPSTSSGCKPLIQCFTCLKTFNNSSALAKHKLIHSDDRKYSCAICSKSFKRQDHLHGHMMTHSAKKPYECCFARCDKSYCDARSLRRHHENHHFQLLESGQRDFPLNSGDGKTFDPSAFKDTNHWTTGFNPLDEPKPVKCSVCGKRFRNLPALNGHMRLHGGYMRQVKSEVPDASDVEKDVISESLETSCASLSSEDANLDQPASKSDHFNNMSGFVPGTMNIKQELSNDHFWNNSQNWCNNDIKYPNNQMPASISSSCSNDSTINQFFHSLENNQDRPACFYPAGQSSFQSEVANSGLVPDKAVPAPPHPSLSSPCLAVSPPSTPGHLKQCYANAPYNTKYYRRAITPICHSNVVNSFAANKCQQTMHRNLTPQNTNLQRTTSAVFPQGHPHSPFSSNNYTPASATTSNFFQFPPSYEDVSPPTSQNHAHLSYTHQFPNTSPFLNIQSRPRTPYTPNTPGRSCRQFYYNHGEESPITPNMRGYGHKTYHPYHSNYRYYPQLKHHNSVQSFPNIDSEFNKCLEMLEKGNIDNMSQSKVNVVGGSAGHFNTNLKQVDALMDYASGSCLPGIDLNCLAEEASFCAAMEENHSAEWASSVNRPVQNANNFAVAGGTAKNDLQNAVFHGNSSYVPQSMKSCDSFNDLNSQITNNNNSALKFKEAVPNNNSHINHYSVNFDFSQPQNQQNSFGSSMHMGTDHPELASLSVDPSTPTNEKRKKKHKPQPLWIPADVSNFADTGGCFADRSNECERPSMTNCRKKAPPPPYICITPVSAAPNRCSLSLDPQSNQVLPNSAPPFHDFSMEISDSMSSGLNGF